MAPPACKSAKRTTGFQFKHQLEFPLSIVSRDAKGAVDTVQCDMCVYFGREEREGPGVKRQRTESKMYWKPPYRKENFKNHMTGQHPIQWAAYHVLSKQEKEHFFDSHKKQSMHAYMDSVESAINISAPIVENIIGDMFFHPEDDEDDDDTEPVTKANAMKLFKREADGSYLVTIKNPTRFWLALDHTSAGLSFRQTATVIDHHKNRTKNPKLAGLNDHMVGQFVRILVGANLQTMANILSDPSVWSFALAGDGSTQRGVSFFDIRVRVCVRGVLYNLHLVALPFFLRHTAINITALICNVLDNMCSGWRDKLIAVSSDGENTMTGRIGGVVTLLEKEATNTV
jgi:hypothetical protein